MVDLDAAGQVVRVAPGAERRWTSTASCPASGPRADVEREFGPPARVERVRQLERPILTYRWRDRDSSDMFYWVYLDAATWCGARIRAWSSSTRRTIASEGRPMRLIFAGTPEFARVALERLHAAGFQIPLVLTQPDRPAGRGMKLQASPVKQFAQAARHRRRAAAQPAPGRQVPRRRGAGARRDRGRAVPT